MSKKADEEKRAKERTEQSLKRIEDTVSLCAIWQYLGGCAPSYMEMLQKTIQLNGMRRVAGQPACKSSGA